MNGIIRFGHYEQDGDASDGAEEIEWIILARTSDRALIVSRYALDTMPYYNSYQNTSWEKSNVRQWLNGDFFGKYLPRVL